ncbi:hypothetical protein PAAG_11896 [Paracoccidioides lutzii Pb01]|uniref:Uncharacterized protein n=1 Tax=Paracoccidioides lutzii (strain ATCC MYA-826 / Pb01) TaxID=502779 RepID=A0A0A2VKK8_PARBA|nr:hypothetical protein PAAG_11896 [Paracoccidioides lutzii Pb01]KGQ01429.1 hypothetical protein PAAG_11896 [Paracoccidioides lutzii Pb01]
MSSKRNAELLQRLQKEDTPIGGKTEKSTSGRAGEEWWVELCCICIVQSILSGLGREQAQHLLKYGVHSERDKQLTRAPSAKSACASSTIANQVNPHTMPLLAYLGFVACSKPTPVVLGPWYVEEQANSPSVALPTVGQPGNRKDGKRVLKPCGARSLRVRTNKIHNAWLRLAPTR